MPQRCHMIELLFSFSKKRYYTNEVKQWSPIFDLLWMCPRMARIELTEIKARRAVQCHHGGILGRFRREFGIDWLGPFQSQFHQNWAQIWAWIRFLLMPQGIGQLPIRSYQMGRSSQRRPIPPGVCPGSVDSSRSRTCWSDPDWLADSTNYVGMGDKELGCRIKQLSPTESTKYNCNILSAWQDWRAVSACFKGSTELRLSRDDMLQILIESMIICFFQ